MMPRVGPFIILVLVSSIVFFYVLYKKRDVKLLYLFGFMIGLAYALEYVIFVLLDSYHYDPGITSSRFIDGMFGSIASQAFAFPVAAITVVAYEWKFKQYIWVAVFFMGVEELFLALHIYEHEWWKTIYTGILMTIGFAIAKIWYYWMKTRYSTFLHVATLYFLMIAINCSIMFVASTILHLYYYKVGLFSDPNRDHINMNTIYVVVMTWMYVWIIVKRKSYLWKIAVIILMFIIDTVLLHTGILHSSRPFLRLTFLIMNVLDLWLIAFLNGKLLRHSFQRVR